MRIFVRWNRREICSFERFPSDVKSLVFHNKSRSFERTNPELQSLKFTVIELSFLLRFGTSLRDIITFTS